VGIRLPLIVAFGFSLLLTPLAGGLGSRVGILDHPTGGSLKLHRAPIPLTGGLAVVAAAMLGITLFRGLPPAGVAAAVMVALGAGALDDARPLRPLPRVIGLAVAGAALALLGAPGQVEGLAATVGVVALVLACANATNLLDGQDGLAGGIAAIAALGLSAVLVRLGAPSAAAVGLATAGSLLGFLAWNRPPARVFLGNGGAYAVGTFLAALATTAVTSGGMRGLAAAGVCQGIFAFELVFTVARRVRWRGRLAAGDRLHSYDLMAARTGDRGRVTLAFWAAGAILAATGYSLVLLPALAAVALFAVVAIVGLAVGIRLWAMVGTTLRNPP
jgi:UDP-N-acetylmuramyl pentapeptide phosphotransferase/UDP-N-acetylglucosamine-1-phosphate transferase